MNMVGVDDRTRLAAILGGDQAAAARLLEDVSAPVWTACKLLSGGEDAAREAFLEVMAAWRDNGFGRLRGYKSGSLQTFIVLSTRDLLAARMLRLLREDGERGWSAFERFFENDIRRLIRRRLPGPTYEDTRRDAYQDICLSLIDNDYRRLKAYGGTGSFTGFVLQTVDRLAIDLVRSLNSRRRLPAAIVRLSALDQHVFKLVYWKRLPARPDVLAPALRGHIDPLPSGADIEAALARVRAAAPDVAEAGSRRAVSLSDIPDHLVDAAIGEGDISPEDIMLNRQQDEMLSLALQVMKTVSDGLTDAEKLYVDIMLSGSDAIPAREIARLMQRPVEEVYKLKQKVLKHLREAMEENAAVKTWRASV
ncbi:MAG TPA: hypothetical protein VF449_06615 [Parvibaculum sp.]